MQWSLIDKEEGSPQFQFYSPILFSLGFFLLSSSRKNQRPTLTKDNCCVNLSGDFSCSLFKLQLKFVQTTRVVCTNFAECWTYVCLMIKLDCCNSKVSFFRMLGILEVQIKIEKNLLNQRKKCTFVRRICLLLKVKEWLKGMARWIRLYQYYK